MDKNIIFVIGSGRSGTHLIGRIIGSHSDVDAYIENPITFELSTKIATGQVSKTRVRRLIKRYDKLFKHSTKTAVLEKSHPNIWMVEELANAYPKAKFVGIYRDVYSTVASMLKHQGVSAWFDILPQNKLNPFLGITAKNIDDYAAYSIEQKAALRWQSHYLRLRQLEQNMSKKSIMIIDYNELLKNQELYLEKLSSFLELSDNFEPETFNLESLTKWKEQLTEKQISLIDSVL